jgi:octaprenyl-diphosphate synthase
MAYQIIDDLLDYNPNAMAKGKSVGNDLAEGKMTLPLIFARQVAHPEEVACIDEAIQTKSSQELNKIIAIIDRTNAKDLTYVMAKQHILQAQAQLKGLKPSPSQEALYALTNFVINREY